MDLVFAMALTAAAVIGAGSGAMLQRGITTRRVGEARDLASRIVG